MTSDLMDLSQFQAVFFEEAAENLATMEELLIRLDLDEPDNEELNAIFRAAHSLKGGSATFGFGEMTNITHELETLLDLARNNEIQLNTPMIDVLLESCDVLKAQLEFYKGESGSITLEAEPVIKRIKVFVNQETRSEPTFKSAKQVIEPKNDDGFGFFDEESEVVSKDVDNQDGYGFFASDEVLKVDALPEEKNEGYGFFDNQISETTTITNEIANKPIAQEKKERVAASPVAKDAESASIRVSVEKVDQLINMVGELVITQSMLAQTASQFDPAKYEALFSGLAQLERNTRDLQESVMSVRMMPIAVVFNRFPRLVRDIAGKLNKQVQLKMIGERTELDKGLVEKISDPLTHLVRNSLDHGVESPEARLAAGKAEQGTVTLRAFHQGGSIVIEVSDDGQGLNREKILAKAKERGLAVHDAMPDQDVWQLIFEAGFSTADQVTDLSGRGVGMDVVKRNIQSMGGRVEIDSEMNIGTRISIRLPLTLAILDGMSVGVGDESFIIPLAQIVESLCPDPSAIRSISSQEHVLHVRGEYLPIISLKKIFNIHTESDSESKGIMVILEADGIKSAFLVDELQGQHQVVVKSIEGNYKKVPGLSGATIMGDGKVAFILDVPGLVRLSKQ